MHKQFFHLLNEFSRNFFIIIGIFFLVQPANAQDEKYADQAGIDTITETIWNVKAYRPDAFLLNVKAIDKDGNIHDVKAIQNSDDTSILDVKAFVTGSRLPIKMIVKAGDRYYPVKAITESGTIVDIKAITDEGEILDVKGVSKSGNTVHIRAITKYGEFYNVIAVSPGGETNNVKGIKMMGREVEVIINGIKVFAHVKAIHQN